MFEGLFWIIVSFSDGGYNKGNMDQLDIKFKTEASCQLTVEQLKSIYNPYNPEWGNNVIGCVSVDNR